MKEAKQKLKALINEDSDEHSDFEKELVKGEDLVLSSTVCYEYICILCVIIVAEQQQSGKSSLNLSSSDDEGVEDDVHLAVNNKLASSSG
jgi:hypothetical protein